MCSLCLRITWCAFLNHKLSLSPCLWGKFMTNDKIFDMLVVMCDAAILIADGNWGDKNVAEYVRSLNPWLSTHWGIQRYSSSCDWKEEEETSRSRVYRGEDQCHIQTLQRERQKRSMRPTWRHSHQVARIKWKHLWVLSRCQSRRDSWEGWRI